MKEIIPQRVFAQLNDGALNSGRNLCERSAAMSNEIPVNGTTMANPGASKAAISFHYDLGNEFVRLFLDRECCYSCVPCTTKSPTLSKQLSNGNSSTTFSRRVRMVLPASSILDVVGARCKSGW
jgi:Mycolic acid cyclopropane synthetase